MTDFDLERAVRDGCRTRDGRPVRIICTDRPHDKWPVVALWEDGTITAYTPGGSGTDVKDDLVNLPETHEVTVQLWRHEGGGFCLEARMDDTVLSLPPPGSAPAYEEWGQPMTIKIPKGEG